MAKRKFWLGMLVMVLVFGMAVIGCDNHTTERNNIIGEISSEYHGEYWGNITFNGILYQGYFIVNATSISGNGLIISGLRTYSGGNWHVNDSWFGTFFYVFKDMEKIGSAWLDIPSNLRVFELGVEANRLAWEDFEVFKNLSDITDTYKGNIRAPQ